MQRSALFTLFLLPLFWLMGLQDTHGQVRHPSEYLEPGKYSGLRVYLSVPPNGDKLSALKQFRDRVCRFEADHVYSCALISEPDDPQTWVLLMVETGQGDANVEETRDLVSQNISVEGFETVPYETLKFYFGRF